MAALPNPPSTKTLSATLGVDDKSDAAPAKSLEALSTSTLAGSGDAPISGGSSTTGGDDLQGLEKQETVFSQHNPRAFPDGGLKAWLCVFGAFCCLFCSFGLHPPSSVGRP